MASPDDHDPIHSQAHAPTLLTPAPAATLPDAPGVTDATVQLDLGGRASTDAGLAQRYELRRVLGEGGMGEVRLCRDRRLGREVAIKVIREIHAARAEVRARFELEARVLGQLEHPSIVPIYDLGVDGDGAPYFTMRRLGGQTLEEVLLALRDGRAGAATAFPMIRLLAVFTSVCQAVAFAHARGVVHRDLKPANVMLGDFGEVCVVDWGLAKVIGVAELASGIPDEDGETGSASPATRAGEAIGTPGYMAPEQIRGDLDRIDERSDVYALGAILFEILSLEPLHRGASVPALYTSTLDGADARASQRSPDRHVPPELEAVCVRATAVDPAGRYQSVRDLLAVVDGYLAGDRDLERRRALAAEHATAAVRAAAFAAHRDDDAGATRQAALRDATAALALDPGQRDALAVLARLLLTAPTQMPTEARRELEATGRVVQRAAARSSVLLYLGWLIFLPLLLAVGVRDWTLFAVGTAVLLAAIASAALGLRGSRRGTALFVAFVLSTVLIGLLSTMLGPHIVVPNLACTSVLAFVLFGDRRQRIPAVILGVLSFVVPLLLQLGGVVPSSYQFSESGFAVVPRLIELPEWGVHVLLVMASLALVAPIGAFVGNLRDQVERSEEALFLQAWTLRQLLPDQVGRATAAQPAQLPGT